jgi:predicted XRE-type DNA-binding protein
MGINRILVRNSRPKREEIPIEKGSGNVYADLGFSDSDDMLIKAQLVTKIAEILRQRRLTQAQAAKTLRLTQPKISRLLRGDLRGISERRLLQCLTRLGRDVHIIVKQTSQEHTQGRLTVRFA